MKDYCNHCSIEEIWKGKRVAGEGIFAVS